MTRGEILKAWGIKDIKRRNRPDRYMVLSYSADGIRLAVTRFVGKIEARKVAPVSGGWCNMIEIQPEGSDLEMASILEQW